MKMRWSLINEEGVDERDFFVNVIKRSQDLYDIAVSFHDGADPSKRCYFGPDIVLRVTAREIASRSFVDTGSSAILFRITEQEVLTWFQEGGDMCGVVTINNEKYNFSMGVTADMIAPIKIREGRTHLLIAPVERGGLEFIQEEEGGCFVALLQ